jgi:rubredoxin
VVSLHEQDLERAIVVPAAAAQQDHGRRGTGRRRLIRHAANLPPQALGWPRVEASTETKQLWMCTSCGFIYDPDEGDPDGGIPPGTRFEDIPDSWFCPVCGARKADFEPYEE